MGTETVDGNHLPVHQITGEGGDDGNVDIGSKILRHDFDIRLFKPFQDIDNEFIPRFILHKQGIIIGMGVFGDAPSVSFDKLRQTVNDRLFIGVPRRDPVGVGVEQKRAVLREGMINGAGGHEDLLVACQVMPPYP